MIKFILTCEHGGNEIPSAYSDLFQNKEELLQSHRGYDPGALQLFDKLQPLADKAFYSTTSRLLVELNRSLNHKSLFSEQTRTLPEQQKKQLLKQYYKPYREQLEELIEDLVMVGHCVLHISVHSFTPVLDGQERMADIGLLYDPKRSNEQQFCRAWKKALLEENKNLVVRFNYPYLGTADGLPTYLRRKFKNEQYIGIELEVNQKYVQGPESEWQKMQQVISKSLKGLLKQWQD